MAEMKLLRFILTLTFFMNLPLISFEYEAYDTDFEAKICSKLKTKTQNVDQIPQVPTDVVFMVLPKELPSRQQTQLTFVQSPFFSDVTNQTTLFFTENIPRLTFSMTLIMQSNDSLINGGEYTCILVFPGGREIIQDQKKIGPNNLLEFQIVTSAKKGDTMRIYIYRKLYPSYNFKNHINSGSYNLQFQ